MRGPGSHVINIVFHHAIVLGIIAASYKAMREQVVGECTQGRYNQSQYVSTCTVLVGLGN